MLIRERGMSVNESVDDHDHVIKATQEKYPHMLNTCSTHV